MANIWAFVEQANGAPSTLGLELLTKARTMGDVTALLLGEAASDTFEVLGQYGASSVIHIDAGDRLPSGPTGAALAAKVDADAPDMILFGQGLQRSGHSGSSRGSTRGGRPLQRNRCSTHRQRG